MHKSMAGSLFTEARGVTVVVFMRENAQTSF